MSSSPIVVTIAGDDRQLNQVLAGALAKIRTFGAEGGNAGEKIKKSFGDAKGAAALLNEELDLGLNRHLRGILATSSLIGPALNLAFPIAAAIGFFEVLERIPEAINSAAESLAGFTDKLKEVETDAVKNNEKLLTSFKDISKGFLILQGLREQSANQKEPPGIFGGLGQAYAGLGIIGVIEKIRENIKERNADIDKGVNIQKLEIEVNERLAELYKEHAKQLEEAAKKAAELRKEMEKEAEAIFRSVQGLSDQSLASKGRLASQLAPGLGQTDVLQVNPTPSDALSKQHIQNLKDQQGWYDATRTSAEKYAKAIEDLNREFENDKSSETYRRALKQINDEFDESQKAAMEFGAAIGDALKQGVLMGRSWQNVLESLLVTISQIILKMTVLKSLQNSSFGSSGFGGFLTALVSGFTGGHASGGFLAPGQWGIAGENGPEPIFAGSSGLSVVPNRGGGNVYHIDARGADMGVELRVMRAIEASRRSAIATSVAISRENPLRGRS